MGNKSSGATTLLYSQVKKLNQALANKNGKVKYTITTAVPSIFDWLDKYGGKDLFEWDYIKEKMFEDGSGPVKTYVKYFYKQ